MGIMLGNWFIDPVALEIIMLMQRGLILPA
jgi:hypothetical protein